MSFLLILLISVILFLIFSEPVSIRLTRSYDTAIDINFFFTGIVLYPERNKRKKKSKKNLADRLRKKGLIFLASGKSVAFLLNNSSITVRHWCLTQKTDNPATAILVKEGYDAIISAALLYFLKKYDNIVFDVPSDENSTSPLTPSIDITALTNLFFVFCSFFVFVFEILIKKIKRGVRLVRNKNE